MAKRSIAIQELKSPQEIRNLKNYLQDLFVKVDPLLLTASPNGVTNATRGRLALVTTGGNYYLYVNVDGATSWRGVQLTAT